MTITIVIINPRQEKWLGCGWRHAQKRLAENFEDFEKRYSLSPTMVLRSWGPTMVLRNWGPTMVLRIWGPTMALRSWGPTMVLRIWYPTMVLWSWRPTMVLRSWSLTRQLRIWDSTMQADSWVPAIGEENWILCHWVEFSTVAAAVKFFRSWPSKMNWDLKHHEMCWTLGILLA